MKEKRTKEHSTNKRNTVAVVALLLVCWQSEEQSRI